MSHLPCSPLVVARPNPPRGGKGFQNRFDAYIYADLAARAYNERNCSGEANPFWGFASPNDCADGLTGTAWHRRGARFEAQARCSQPCSREA
jgi:hypothetical protein